MLRPGTLVLTMGLEPTTFSVEGQQKRPAETGRPIQQVLIFDESALSSW